MACLNVRQLQGYLEDADADAARLVVEHHLVECNRCRGTFDRLAATNHRVNTWLAALSSPLEQGAFDVTAALGRVLASQHRPARAGIAAESVLRRFRAGGSAWLLSAKAVSAAIHIAVFSLLMIPLTNTTVRNVLRPPVELVDPVLRPYIPEKAGGGGGGDLSPVPVSKGQLPKPEMKQFTPPIIVEQKPKLEMDPSILAPPDTALPESDLPNWGDPLAKIGVLANGVGSGGGMGDGDGGGVGSGHGAGYGAGDNGGFGGGTFSAGPGVSRPVLIYKPDPEYSDEARKARYGGSVMLSIVVDTDGRARDIHVVESLGMGLDEKAIEAVSKWKFRPAMKDGRPVAVRATIQVNFRLL